ncbi:SGNH/GDSL hydrolase family protein [Massilia sp. R2A-15]|uniref:SGNH/GDSL hydrolase family protein n=1 Tax=Massilia sp. R2A-15 TaxID=3064278 RepID=UPI00273764BF|nr:SGNH/GDSL hydrolase family protein [Massilia sp. R2A-15]WLI89578.1 SGNH/GDSL hydrolase family protein [Massilia sp. R2A-15]
MRHLNFVLVLFVAAMLAACGDNGSRAGDQTLKTKFSAQITFGDSLADVGTYAVGPIAAAGGGKYTINGNNVTLNPALTGTTWSELMAAQLSLPAPCAAQTGLDGDPAQGFSVPVVNHAGCFGYAQGGARVTNPVGPRNKLTGSPLGQLTVPVVTQIANHLAVSGGRFKSDEIVFLLAGGNDAFILLDQLAAGALAAGQAAGASTFASSLVAQLAAGATDPASASVAIGTALQAESARPGHTDASVVQAAVTAAAQQPGNAAGADPAVYGPMVTKAQSNAAAAGAAAGAKYARDNGPAVVTAMGTAGAELAALVKNRIVANGANFVVVNALPDIAITPGALAQPAETRELIKAMVASFNDQLKAGIAGDAKILFVDLYALTHDESANPAPYGLTNTTMAACGANALGGASLVCNGGNLAAGDVSHFMFADDYHPTPFEHLLVARYISQQMIARGWI